MKNLLFTGNPATGKTFLARAAAYYLCYEKLNIDSLQSKDIYKDWDKIEDFICSERCEFIQVHPSMTYEDIVNGIDIKATGTMTVDYVEKRIKKLCDRAGTTEELCAASLGVNVRSSSGWINRPPAGVSNLVVIVDACSFQQSLPYEPL